MEGNLIMKKEITILGIIHQLSGSVKLEKRWRSEFCQCIEMEIDG
jgi:hypothetical protein